MQEWVSTLQGGGDQAEFIICVGNCTIIPVARPRAVIEHDGAHSSSHDSEPWPSLATLATLAALTALTASGLGGRGWRGERAL